MPATWTSDRPRRCARASRPPWRRSLASGSRPICLGGDHSVTYPVLRAMRAQHPKLAILHFDAHSDLYDALDGDRYSHACPFARIMEEGLADRLVQVGIRTMNAHQRSQAERFGVEVNYMKDWDDARIFAFDEPLYVSVDLDVLDPAFAPGLSHREPGGCSVRQLLRVIQTVRADYRRRRCRGVQSEPGQRRSHRLGRREGDARARGANDGLRVGRRELGRREPIWNDINGERQLQ